MKQKKLSIILIFILIFSSLIISLSSSVNADIGDIIIEDWNDYNLGEISGNGKNFDWKKVQGEQPIIDNNWNNPDLSLYMCLSDSSIDDIGYINTTGNFTEDYIGKISLNVKGMGSNDISYFYHIEFYDDNDNLLIHIKVNTFTNSGDFQILEPDNDWVDVDYGTGRNFEGWLNISHVSGNIMNYSFYNGTSIVDYQVSSTYSTNDWSTFDYIKIYDDAYNSGTNSFWLNDIIINENSDQQSESCVLNGVILTINGVYDGLVDIEQGEPTLFNFLKHSSSTCAEYGIEITDSEDHVVYSKVTYLTSWWFYKSFHSAGEYTLHIWDILNSDGYDVYGNFTVYNSTRINSYVDYGNMFAEIYTDGNDCYYDTLDSPSVIYAVNDSLLKTGCEYYIADIVDNSGKLFQSVYLRNTSGVIKIQDLNTKSFKYADLYHINLYNTTLINDNYVRDSLIYVSRQVEVCDEDGSGSSNLDDDEEIFGVPGSLLFTMVGLIIVFMGFIFPSIIEHNMNAKGHRVNIPREVNVFSGLIAIIGCVMMGFFTLWIIFMFALAMLVFIIMKAKKYI